jgi:hypothetical protein
MPAPITTAELDSYQRRINSGGLQAAIQVYGELYAKGYNYAGWASGVATGGTVTGVSALSYLSSTALMGIGSDACRNLTQGQIDKIRVDMSGGYLTTLSAIASNSGGVLSRDVNFRGNCRSLNHVAVAANQPIKQPHFC